MLLLEQPGFSRRMTRDEINELPLSRFEGEITVVQTKDELAAATNLLSKETVLGFDTETRPAFKKGQRFSPSLVQLAGNGSVYIFLLKKLKFAKPLRDLLADTSIVKAGVATAFDIIELNKLNKFTPGGFIDLGEQSKAAGIKNHGLRGLAAVLLGIRIAKGARTSNWAKLPLTESQIRYAATDAWACRKIYMQFEKKGILTTVD